MGMQKITAESSEAKSADIVAGNVAALKEMFPEAFTEGKIDFEVLKQLLGGVIDEREEKYGLNWHGKRKARQLALSPSTGTLRPAPGEGVDEDTTQNIVIEGDNLEVLKLLQKSYSGKVKLIYIDPPYNTGNDYIYPDNFHHSIRNYLEITGQVDGEARLTSNRETSGRYHTDWLSMMYPRLFLARGLLRADGILIISCDDSEIGRLRAIVEDIYGEENCCATLVWDRNRKNDAKYFSVGHEYMLVVFKNESELSEREIIFRGVKEGVEELREKFQAWRDELKDDWEAVRVRLKQYYSSIDAEDPRHSITRFAKVDEKGPYRDDGNINWPGGDGPRYAVSHPKTKKPCKLPASGWRYPTPERFWEEVGKGRVVFGEDETTVPRVRTNLFENNEQVMGSVHYSYAQTATNEFVALFNGERVFQNPKPVSDLKQLIGYLTTDGDVVLDFFAGSGTTGHAVMTQNAADGGNRRYMLVQLPEPLDPENKDQKTAANFCDSLRKPRTIAELTKERLRRAGMKVKTENPMFAGDIGFRVFKLDSSNIRAWDPKPKDLDASLLDAMEHLKSDRSEGDILTELLLKLGLDLTVPVESKAISRKTVHSIGAGVLLVCLDTSITRKDAEPLALGIVEWHKELAPVGDSTVVFRDSAFEDDVAKSNLAAILTQNGLSNGRSL